MSSFMHSGGYGSESISSSICCSTSRATRFFHSFPLPCMSTAGLQRRTVWFRQRYRSYMSRAGASCSDMEWKQNFCVSRATCLQSSSGNFPVGT